MSSEQEPRCLGVGLGERMWHRHLYQRLDIALDLSSVEESFPVTWWMGFDLVSCSVKKALFLHYRFVAITFYNIKAGWQSNCRLPPKSLPVGPYS